MEMIVTHLNTINTISSSTLLFFLSFLELTWHNNYATLHDDKSPLCSSSQTLDESSVSTLTRGNPRDGRRVSNKLQTRSFGVSECVPSPGVGRVDRAHQTTRPVRNQVRPNAVLQPGPETLQYKHGHLYSSPPSFFCRIYLIGSTPGRFQGSNMEKWGHLKLRKV